MVKVCAWLFVFNFEFWHENKTPLVGFFLFFCFIMPYKFYATFKKSCIYAGYSHLKKPTGICMETNWTEMVKFGHQIARWKCFHLMESICLKWNKKRYKKSVSYAFWLCKSVPILILESDSSYFWFVFSYSTDMFFTPFMQRKRAHRKRSGSSVKR